MGKGLLAKESAALILDRCPAARYAVISDTNVGPIYGDKVTAALNEASPTKQFTFAAGEQHKNRKTWATLHDSLLASRFGRDSAIVAVGGGVVGDVAGFVAATFMRGIPYVNIPTTLLAMIDSSVGGKTGVDTEYGKNLVGSFHQPKLVITDIGTLDTLDKKQFTAGIAEALKHGAVADARYLELLRANHDSIVSLDEESLTELIKGSVEIKAPIVAGDERELARRAILNFGHSIGHAIEAATEYQILHGEAVAAGMILEAALGESMGVTEKGTRETLEAALAAFGLDRLPVTMPDRDTILKFIHRDKKTRDDQTRFSLLQRLGTPAQTPDGQWTIGIPDDVLKNF